jgi:hypothetical protein
MKQEFRNASILKDGRVVFNIAGNKYRLVVWINSAYWVEEGRTTYSTCLTANSESRAAPIT